MKEALIKLLKKRGGDIHFANPLKLENWPEYKLIGVYLDGDELRIVSSQHLWDIDSHLNQRWGEVCEDYQKAVCAALGITRKRDKNLF